MNKPIQKILIKIPKMHRLLNLFRLFEWDEHVQNWTACGLAISYLFKGERNWNPLNISAQRLYSFSVAPHYIKKFFVSLEVNLVHPFHEITARGFFLEEELWCKTDRCTHPHILKKCIILDYARFRRTQTKASKANKKPTCASHTKSNLTLNYTRSFFSTDLGFR